MDNKIEGFFRKWRHLAYVMLWTYVFKSMYAVWEWLLRLPVTIVRDSSATSSSQIVMIKSVCMTWNLSETG